MLFRDTLRTIKKSVSRYISILLIVALGTAFYTGIKATAPDMFATAKTYFNEYNLMDIRIQSSIGLTDDDVTALKNISGIEYARGEKYIDALVRVNGEAECDLDGTQISTRAYSISPTDISNFLNGVDDGNYINRVELIEGSYPTSSDQCLVDASRLSTPDSYKIGSTITLEKSGGSAPDNLSANEFTIVGIIRSPYYLSFERGNTDIGSGKIGTFILIPDEAFTADYYSEIYVKVTGADSYEPFSDDYFNFIEPYVTAVKSIADTQVNARVETLRPQLLKTIEDGEESIASQSSGATTDIKTLDDTIATLQNLVDNGEQLIADAEAEFNEKFGTAESTLSDSSAELSSALSDYQTKYQTWLENKNKYDESATELSEKQALYDSLYSQVTSARQQVNTLNANVTTINSLVTAAENVLQAIEDKNIETSSTSEVQAIITMMQATYPELYSAVKSLSTSGLATEIIANVEPYLEQEKLQLAKTQKELEEKKATLDELASELETMKQQLEAASAESASTKQQLESAASDLSDYKEQLTSKGYTIQNSDLQLQIQRVQAETELKELKAQVEAAPANLAEVQKKKEEANSQLSTSLSDAQSKLDSAKKLYEKLDDVAWNVYDRSDTPGYSSYGQSVSNINMLSNIFPVFFFLIAALVCLTTMTRLIEEERVLLGTYKALGYTVGAIMAKYIIYSLSACLFGTITGVSTAIFGFPYLINSAYSIMYSLPSLIYKIPWLDIGICFLASFLCTTVSTMFAVAKELTLPASVLMRPKAPKAGKRILLERFKFIWKHLKFSSKVTARNLFRHKTRFLMTIIGIAGCGALILASLGMYDSVSAIVSKQYGDNAITKYDLQIAFDNAQSTETHSAEFNNAKSDTRISSLMLTSIRSMVGFGEDRNEKTDVYVLVPENPSELSNYIDLRSRTSKDAITLDDTGAVITEKLAKTANVDVGDQINFADSDGNIYTVTVSAIAENYTFHYIYMTQSVYKQAVGEDPEFYYAMGTLADSVKNDTSDDGAAKGRLASDLVEKDGITSLSYTTDSQDTISKVTDALSWVIVLFIAAATVLAFVVLYNLSNINIIERNRELATLKVLGFSDREMNAYIYRENIILSVIGIVFGVVLGILLHRALITFTSVDTVMYGQTISWYNYLISIGLTVCFIVAVNMLLRTKIRKIDMVSSLKSVE